MFRKKRTVAAAAALGLALAGLTACNKVEPMEPAPAVGVNTVDVDFELKNIDNQLQMHLLALDDIPAPEELEGIGQNLDFLEIKLTNITS
mgnify:CR=1 FL=1